MEMSERSSPFLFQYARVEQAAHLSDIAKQAKAWWGYPQQWLDDWAQDLSISAQQIKNDFVLVAHHQNSAIAFIHLINHQSFGIIDGLWVLPDYMRQGVGQALLQQAKAHGLKTGLSHLQVTTDPNALEFYKKHGGVVISTKASTPAGRFLDVLEISL